MENVDYEASLRGFDASELDYERLQLVRQLGRVTEQLAFVNAERVSRTPQNQQAVIIDLGEVS
jgi:hypothetical protein